MWFAYSNAYCSEKHPASFSYGISVSRLLDGWLTGLRPGLNQVAQAAQGQEFLRWEGTESLKSTMQQRCKTDTWLGLLLMATTGQLYYLWLFASLKQRVGRPAFPNTGSSSPSKPLITPHWGRESDGDPRETARARQLLTEAGWQAGAKSLQRTGRHFGKSLGEGGTLLPFLYEHQPSGTISHRLISGIFLCHKAPPSLSTLAGK